MTSPFDLHEFEEAFDRLDQEYERYNSGERDRLQKRELEITEFRREQMDDEIKSLREIMLKIKAENDYLTQRVANLEILLRKHPQAASGTLEDENEPHPMLNTSGAV